MVGLGAALLPLRGATAGRERTKPNVLFLFSDDQRFDTIHVLGNEQIVTPNLDRLVAHGTAFTHAYIMGGTSGAVCMPSRAMLLSGRTLFHLDRQGQTVPAKHVTFPEAFRHAGYATFHTGKWHQNPAMYNRCFEQGARIFFGGMSDHFKVPVQDYDSTGQYSPQRTYTVDGTPSSELFSDAAIDFLKSYQGSKPFLMYVAYTAPHDPRLAPQQYMDMYKPEAMELPKSFMPEHPFDNGDMKLRDEQLAPWPRTPEEVRRHTAAYYAMITHLDAQIGRVLETLRQTGHAEDTIVVFAADNGLALGRHGLFGKQNLYEHSVHVPLIFCGPDVHRGEKREAFCYLIDIYPTLCELAGLQTPDTVEGRSLVPVLRDAEVKVRDTLFSAYRDFQRAVRDERFKLIEYHVAGTRTRQLFDLQNDPWELQNLAADGRYEQQLHSLRNLLVQWKKKLDDNSNFWQDYTT